MGYHVLKDPELICSGILRENQLRREVKATGDPDN